MTVRPGQGCCRTASAFSADAGRAALAAILAAAAVSGLAILVWDSPARAAAPAAAAGAARGWVEVDYGDLLDRRRLTHSGDSVGKVIERLAERPDDALSRALLDPILEPYAFVLSDALDAISGVPDRPRVEVGALWQPGQAQPAWAELLRARAILVESDGEGRLRVCAPWRGEPGEEPSADVLAAAARAYERAWPVLRLAFAAEMRRLGLAAGDGPEAHPLEVEIHPYVHEPARSRFRLGVEAYRARVADTRPRGDRPPLDLDGVQAFLDRGLLLEGGRLEEDGALRLLGSETKRRPSLLGRPIALSDWAVAYRAVFHGGLAEPYMSLDRGAAPQTSLVNYGGRLRDTSVGLVSLLCDIRFKTFSLGIDIVADRDERSRVREGIPGFRTHLERLAWDERSKGITGQQTRLWFYPDDVDLTLSEPGDVLVMRRARMTASSERVTQEARAGTRPADPPWTLDTVAAINRDYTLLGGLFPELGDLDHVARILSLFAWLRMAEEDGLAVPDLDALLAVELPVLATPRRFPQLLAFNALPPPGSQGAVDVVSQVGVGEALDRLQPTAGVAIPGAMRLDRALRALDRRLPDHAALAQDIEAMDRSRLDEATLDLLAYRAERLRMHQLVLSTLLASDRERLARREQGLRVFSVGIGGLDLNMTKRVAGASHRSERLAWGAATRRSEVDAPSAGGSAARRASVPVEEWRRDPPRMPVAVLPDHGSSSRAGAEGPIRIESGTSTWDGAKVSWTCTIAAGNAPEPSTRRIVFDASRRLRFVERSEEGRFLRFRFVREAALLRAHLQDSGLPAAEGRRRETAAPPEGLALLEIAPRVPAGASAEAPELSWRIRGGDSGERALSVARPVAQRLVLGRRADLTPGEPLAGLGAPEELAGGAGVVMVLGSAANVLPPWDDPPGIGSGEDDPVRIAAALRDWWRMQPNAPAVVVGSDRSASPGRWKRSPRVSGAATLLAPADAFPDGTSVRREALAAAWQRPSSDSAAPSSDSPALVVLVSAEPPGLLGDRLRRLSRDPSLSGRLVAVVSLAGPVRADLPTDLLAEGRLAGIGIAEASPAGVSRVTEGLVGFLAALDAAGPGGARVEELPAPFLWYF